jgi:SAM-dependent methyltransferase
MGGLNLPIAMRSDVDFGPIQGSVFDDPGDEKSWHVSQRSESLDRFYEAREPSWYASAIAPLRGAKRVLDLGCGPGLALQALLDQGCLSALGVDRWPAFAARSSPRAPIIAHDLTLPMPFLESGSFDGVLSHYALDYVSPIGMRGVLREVHRLLTPGGRLLVYVAAVGMGSGDEARTAAYSPRALQVLLAEAGFVEVDVESSPNGRNSVAKARRAIGDTGSGSVHPAEVRAAIDGDTQLSASFRRAAGRIEFGLAGPGRDVVVGLDMESSEDLSVSVCARVQRSGGSGSKLQLWVWHGCTLVASECARFEFEVKELQVNYPAEIEHFSLWGPGDLSVEAPSNAFGHVDDLVPGSELTEAERGAEGRQVIVEPSGAAPTDLGELLGPGRNRFLIRAAAIGVPRAEREWLAGKAHGVVFDASQLKGERMRDLLLWAAWRQAMVFLRGSDWESVLSAAVNRQTELMSPTVLVDPALAGIAISTPPPASILDFVRESKTCLVLLGAEASSNSSPADLSRLSGRLLHGGPPSKDIRVMSEADETLRYLTERTVLMRLRKLYGRSPAEVGRREAFC